MRFHINSYFDTIIAIRVLLIASQPTDVFRCDPLTDVLQYPASYYVAALYIAIRMFLVEFF